MSYSFQFDATQQDSVAIVDATGDRIGVVVGYKAKAFVEDVEHAFEQLEADYTTQYVEDLTRIKELLDALMISKAKDVVNKLLEDVK